jgi:outer membrane receptor protein involved in Fe transport
MRLHRLLAATLMAGTAFTALSHAQAPAADTTAAVGNEEVVVTAQRRAQKSQTVGIALTAVSGETLSERGITTVNGLENLTPSLEIENQFGSGQVGFSIRGIGFRDYATNNSATVGLYVDEVAYALPIMSQGVLFDIDRVEVLRGPQGTLYGRNSTGGAINVISKKPTEELSAGFVAEYGRFDGIRAEGYVNGAVASGVNARLSASTEQGGAWQVNRETGVELGDADKTAVRLQVDIAPEGSPLTLLLNLHGFTDQGDGVGKKLFTNFPGSFAAAPALAHTGRETSWGTSAAYAAVIGIRPDGKPFRDNEGWGFSANFGADLGFAQLTYIGAYETLDRREYNDFDGLTEGYADVYFVSDVASTSHELRFASTAEGPFSWIAGVYYATEELDELYTSGFNGSFGPAFSVLRVPYKQEVETIAFFGQGEYAFSDQVKLIAGLRWENEQRDLFDAGTFAIGFPGLNFANGTTNGTLESRSTEFDEVTGKVALEYTPTEGLLTYFSISRGIKSGGFTAYNTFNPAGLDPFRPEQLWAYEAGFKSDFFDNTFRLNGAVFYYDYQDQQVQSAAWIAPQQAGGAAALVGRIVNAPESEVYGGELEAVWRATPELTITQAIGYKHGTFQEFLDADFTVVFGTINRAGQDIGFPELSYSGSFTYENDTSMGFSYVASIDYSYRDTQSFPLLGSLFDIESYWLANANLTIRPDGSPIEFGLWGRNIFDEEYDETRNTFNSGAGDNFSVPGRPATYGVRIGAKF